MLATVAIWSLVAGISWLAYERGAGLGGTAEWAGLLHPILFGVTVWPVLRRAVHGGRWLTLPNGILVLTYVMLGLGSVYYVLFPSGLGYPSLHEPGVVRETLLVVLAGVIAFRGAADLPGLSELTRRLPRLPETPAWSSALRIGVSTVLALTVGLQIILLAAGEYGYRPGTVLEDVSGLHSLMSFLSQGGLVALSAGFFYWFGTDQLAPADKALIASAAAVLAALSVLSGMKRELLELALHVGIPYLAAGVLLEDGPSRSVWSRAGLGLALALIPLVFALNPLFRSELLRRGADENRLAVGLDAARSAATSVVTDSDAELPSLVAAGGRQLWRRSAIFPFTAAVIAQVPDEMPHRGVERYIQLLPVAVVPRLLWPDKPTNRSAREFQSTVISGEVVNATNPTIYGWAYWDGGFPAVIAMLFLLGLLAGALDDYLVLRHGYVLSAVVFYAVSWRLLFNIEPDPFWAWGGLPKGFGVAAAAYIAMVYLPRELLPSGGGATRDEGGR